jgi:hypothetical protein
MLFSHGFTKKSRFFSFNSFWGGETCVFPQQLKKQIRAVPANSRLHQAKCLALAKALEIVSTYLAASLAQAFRKLFGPWGATGRIVE